MIGTILRAFRPIDTSEADEAIAAARRSQKDVAVRARALRMDLTCGDPTAAIERVTAKVADQAGHLLRRIYLPATMEPVPDDMTELVGKV